MSEHMIWVGALAGGIVGFVTSVFGFICGVYSERRKHRNQG